MGLDMYLDRYLYLGRDLDGERRSCPVTVQSWDGREYALDLKNLSKVTVPVAYWRKANAIHAWFVEHVQGGTDDCGEYDVSREQLQDLLDVVRQVLAASVMVPGKVTRGFTSAGAGGGWEPILEDGERVKDPAVAAALLPTTEGFFFGLTDYDDTYIDDLRYTEETLAAALDEVDDDALGWSFTYRASW